MSEVTQTQVRKIAPSPIHCSFCGKSQKEVKKMIAGPRVFICDECTELCSDICHEGAGIPHFSPAILDQFKEVQVMSPEILLRLGGLTNEQGPYTAHELYLAFMKGLDESRMTPEERAAGEVVVATFEELVTNMDDRLRVVPEA